MNEPIHSVLKVAWQGLGLRVGCGVKWQRNSDIFRHASEVLKRITISKMRMERDVPMTS